LYVHIEDVAIAVTCRKPKKVGIRAVMSIVLNENDNPLAK